MKKYNILFASHPDYSGNAKAIYEYMKENYKEYNLYYLINDESNYELLKSAGGDCYINGSDEFKKLFDTPEFLKHKLTMYIMLSITVLCGKFVNRLSKSAQ